ncbi:helix-turn-helix transcriptional regulator [Dyadobacter sp. CY326]|uniref:helix-turn-helix transcriptional regulator n=1 Tax=Dyadobacter sp. CY326 TaxID=2907300 RepID=UPI001F370D43|nr:AraC family transcriptional regulator [Dyadobacter sp. CY326]MCE7064726.1 AraC family transcriptional regulator [Dyadobacter sp. CY326]
MEERQSREFDKGKMSGVLWQCDGIRIGHAVSKFTELSSFSSSSKTDVVRMHFGMRGNYSFDYKQLNKTYDLIGGHHNIMYSSDFDMVVTNKTLELETFGIQFPKELFVQFTAGSSDALKRFSQGIMEGKSVILSDKWGVIDAPIQQVIQQIIHCKYADDLKKLFLLSKSIELLVLCADAVSVSQDKKEIYIKNATDKEKIIAVRDLIHERVHCPPNLTEIAQSVGLNEYKLKRGFKETFNNTVFGYLTDQRLALARQYLLDTEQTAAEIATTLGYATPQHFNNAFKKKFGVTPYSVRNNP